MFESNKILDRWHIHGFLLHEVGFFVDWPCRERERWTDWWTDRQTGKGYCIKNLIIKWVYRHYWQEQTSLFDKKIS